MCVHVYVHQLQANYADVRTLSGVTIRKFTNTKRQSNTRYTPGFVDDPRMFSRYVLIHGLQMLWDQPLTTSCYQKSSSVNITQLPWPWA